MSGWSISASLQTVDELRVKPDQAKILAKWKVDAAGCQWIHNLVVQNKATQLQFGGFPDLFEASTIEVVQTLIYGPPHVRTAGPPPNENHKNGKNVFMDWSLIDQSIPSRLTIEVWDQS